MRKMSKENSSDSRIGFQENIKETGIIESKCPFTKEHEQGCGLVLLTLHLRVSLWGLRFWFLCVFSVLGSLVCWMSWWCHVSRSMLWPPSVIFLCWGGRETGLFPQSRQGFLFFSTSNPEWKRKCRLLGPSSLGLPSNVWKSWIMRASCVVTATFCWFYVHTSASLFCSFSKLQTAGRRMALLPPISVIFPFLSLNTASFFKYTLHHGSCHRTCRHASSHMLYLTTLSGDGWTPLFLLQRETGLVILCTLIELKSNFTECKKKSCLAPQKGWHIYRQETCGVHLLCFRNERVKRRDDERRFKVFLLSGVKLLLFVCHFY